MKKPFKSITAFILVVALLQSFGMFSSAIESSKPYYYIEEDGKVIEYYVDENDYEYIYKNGKKMYVLLPLEKYRSEESEEYYTAFDETSEYQSGGDSVQYSTNGYVIISTLFKATVNLPSAVTGYKNYPSNADCLRLKTTNCSPTIGNHNINVHLYVKSRTDGSVYDYHYFNQNCTITQGYALSGRFASQVNVSIVACGNMNSCKLAVTATES